MKKIKIMLSLIALLSILGGIFAFKANRLGAIVYTTSDCNAKNPTCPNETPNVTITIFGDTRICVTDIPDGDCILTYVKVKI